MPTLNPKQNEYIRNANRRWNFKIGAVRSGKSFVDIAYVILSRLRAVKDKPGLNVFLGVSKETIESNVLQPMREIYTEAVVGTINSRNIAIIAGVPVYCLGAEKVSQVSKLQGKSIKYCYGDEVARWNKDVFAMLQSRLDKAYSCFDGSCNPEYPSHWLKKFIDQPDIDAYIQKYTIYDNPALPPDFVANLEKEYKDTVFYDRYILGLWTAAEGIIYRAFADNAEPFIVSSVPALRLIVIGLDYGAGSSKTSIKAVGFTAGYQDVYVLAEKDMGGIYDPETLYKKFHEFYDIVVSRFGAVAHVFGDWGGLGNTLNKGLYIYCKRNGITAKVENCEKGVILERIELTQILMQRGRLHIMRDCINMATAFREALWSDKQPDTRLDDGTTDVDSLDAFEYAIYPFAERLLKAVKNG